MKSAPVIKVGVVLPASIGDPGDYLANARALDAAGAEMLEVDGDREAQWVVLGAIAAVTERIKLRTPSGRNSDQLDRLSRGRALVELPANEKWVNISMPADRASWAVAIREQEGAGVTGVIVTWDERLIDLLRNPDPDDRSDLLMSTG